MFAKQQSVSKIIFVPDGKNFYQGVFLTEGSSSYPYPIKTDPINKIMGQRLATYNAMTKMSEDILSLKPFLSRDFQPKIKDSFVKGVFMANQKSGQRSTVLLGYLFVCSEEQCSRMKKQLKNRFVFEKKEHINLGTEDRRAGNTIITSTYWRRLSRFYTKMVGEAEKNLIDENMNI